MDKYNNVIDSRSIYSIECSLSKILNLPLNEIKNRLNINIEKYSSEELIRVIYDRFNDEMYNVNLDGLILYHMTRLSDEMINNIKLKGLKPFENIIDDWINELFVIDDNIANIKNDVYKLNNQKSHRDDYIYSELYIDGQYICFIKDGPDFILNVFNNKEQFKKYILRYTDLEDYKRRTKPYLIKIYLKNSELENLSKYEKYFSSEMSKLQYYICLYLNILCYYYRNLKQQSGYSIKFKKCKVLDILDISTYDVNNFES